MERIYDLAVIGGGASGMAAAIRAAERGKHVLLCEKANRCGRKILASGNGRCNLMNIGAPRYYGDELFAVNVLANIPQEQIILFFRKYGLFLVREENRLYPATFQAASVLAVLNNAVSMSGIAVRISTPVINAYKSNGLFSVVTESGEILRSRKMIVACGGAAQPRLGGCYDGYRILESFGHTIVPVFPALVPLMTDHKSISGLSGTRIRCTVQLIQDGKELHSEEGEVLFTDYGISGICVMQCARFVTEPNASVNINLLHNIMDRKTAYDEIKRRRSSFSSCSPTWLLNGILPENLSFAVLKQAGLQMHGETASSVSDGMLNRIIDTAFAYHISISGRRGFDQAQVTAGGADCCDFNPSTMESRIVSGLYAAGEVLNVDGDCGGYNLMFAFASGLAAGSAV